MPIEAKVIADSITVHGARITTIQAKIHRFVLAELNTHCALARNSASSRAIPTAKFRQMCIDDPALPVEWGSNQPGMQAGAQLDSTGIENAKGIWLFVRDTAIAAHIQLEKLGLHKQVANRLLEPWMYHMVCITATDWDNFFNQRVEKGAQPEMREAATAVAKAYYASAPVLLYAGQWHLPYITNQDRMEHGEGMLSCISAARCARTSYLTQEGTRDLSKDLELYGRLTASDANHWSPLEHPAQATDSLLRYAKFTGWQSLRHQVEPATPKFDPVARGIAASY